jgi:hypothetical protein
MVQSGIYSANLKNTDYPISAGTADFWCYCFFLIFKHLNLPLSNALSLDNGLIKHRISRTSWRIAIPSGL